VLTIDVALFERQLFASGARGPMTDMKSGAPRAPDSTLSLTNTLRSLGLDLRAPAHNAGNDAFLALLALQLLLDPTNTTVPPAAGARRGTPGVAQAPQPSVPMPFPVPSASVPAFPTFTPPFFPGYTPSPAGVSPTGGYFDRRDRRPSTGMGGNAGLGGSARASRSNTTLLTPDEHGVVPRSKSADRLSRNMRDLSMG
jgi:hypothetical protein